MAIHQFDRKDFAEHCIIETLNIQLDEKFSSLSQIFVLSINRSVHWLLNQPFAFSVSKGTAAILPCLSIIVTLVSASYKI